MSRQKTIVVDLDGTLCGQETIANYVNARPRTDVIERVNQLYYGGWFVEIFTARGMVTFHGDLSLIETNLRSLTERWLRENGVKYDVLTFGKPPADHYLDDKSLLIGDFISGNFE